MKNLTEKWRTQPMYSFREAGRLASVSTTTVKNWFLGYTTRNARDVPPLFPDGAERNSMISFVQLIETVVAARFRNSHRLPYSNVHEAYRNAREILRVEYPFAHLRLEPLGGHIIARLEGEEIGQSHQALDLPPQRSLPGFVLEVINQIEYEDDLAAKWFPVGKGRPIVIDPRVSSGIPTIVDRGVTVQTICNRKKAGTGD